MVFSDISDSNPSLNDQGPRFYKAPVLDRFFSFLIDYLIFSPVVSFFLLTLFQIEVSVWRSSLNRAENFPILVLLGTSYILLFSGLQSFFIYFWKATPGQYFLKLQIKMDSAPGLVFFRIWLRQIGFWFSGLFLGLPWLAILAHPSQQTFYDRLGEASVVSLKEKQNYFSFEIEAKYWRSLLGTFVIFFVFIFAGVGWQQHNRIKTAAYTFAKYKKNDSFCKELKSVDLKERLQTAIALNLVGQLSDECVDKEADFTLWKMHDDELLSLAYYAKSLTESDTVAEKSYLQQACGFKKTEYFGCKVSTAFLKKDLVNFYKTISHDSENQNLLSSVLQYELGLAYNLTSQEEINFKNLKQYDQQNLVKKYLLSEIMQHRLVDLAKPEVKRSVASEQKTTSGKAQTHEEDIKYAQKLINQM